MQVIQQCPHLKFKFQGVYAADNFPLKLPINSFVIVNTAKANEYGSHWVLLAKNSVDHTLFSDPLGFHIRRYRSLQQRLSYMVEPIIQYSFPLQPFTSNLCGLYCIYIAHVVFSTSFPNMYMVHENYIKKRFVHHL